MAEIVQAVKVLCDELIVRELIMDELSAPDLIAAEMVMSKLPSCVHSARGIEPVVRGDRIVRSPMSAGAVVRAGDIARKSARAMAGKAVLGKSRAGKAMFGKTRAGKTVAGESPSAHAVRREPVHAT